MARLARDAAVHRAVVEGSSTILDYGTAIRAPSPPRCGTPWWCATSTAASEAATAPATWCDGHHIRWVERGGPTRVANLVLACRRHHHLLHTPGWNAHLDDDGTFTVTTPTAASAPPHHPGPCWSADAGGEDALGRQGGGHAGVVRGPQAAGGAVVGIGPVDAGTDDAHARRGHHVVDAVLERAFGARVTGRRNRATRRVSRGRSMPSAVPFRRCLISSAVLSVGARNQPNPRTSCARVAFHCSMAAVAVAGGQQRFLGGGVGRADGDGRRSREVATLHRQGTAWRRAGRGGSSSRGSSFRVSRRPGGGTLPSPIRTSEERRWRR